MEELRKKLEEESKRIELQKGVGFPLKNLIDHVVQRAENDEAYCESVLASDFAETLIYVVETFQKIIVETEDCIVPDDDAHQILDEWYERSDEREALLKGIGDTKHKLCSSHNIFLSSSYLTKNNLDKMQESFKGLTAINFLIKKYYKEPIKSTYKPSKTVPKTTKKTDNQFSLDIYGTENADEKQEEKAVKEVDKEVTKSEEKISPAATETKDDIATSATTSAEEKPNASEETQKEKEVTEKEELQAVDNSSNETIQEPLCKEEWARQVIKSPTGKSKRKEVEGQFDLFGLL